MSQIYDYVDWRLGALHHVEELSNTYVQKSLKIKSKSK